MTAIVRRSIEPIKIDYRTLSRTAPARAGDLAYVRFCTPRLSERRSPDHEILTERARFHLRNAEWVRVPTTEGEIQAFVFAPQGASKGNVLIVHGWTSESSFMAVIAEQLRRAGFRTVAFDQPAHGLSARTHASLIDCARALIQVADALGPIQYVVAHSMGCLAALLAGEGRPPMSRAYPFARYVLVSGPNRFSVVTREHGDNLGLSPPAQRHYERQLERIAHRRIADFTAAKLLAATGRPALVLHDRGDEEVAFRCAEEIAAACPAAELVGFDGLGHRNILFAPPVIRAALAFLSRP
jgi:pimeloyl-ACP methyl ester carboxylesterase